MEGFQALGLLPRYGVGFENVLYVLYKDITSKCFFSQTTLGHTQALFKPFEKYPLNEYDCPRTRTDIQYQTSKEGKRPIRILKSNINHLSGVLVVGGNLVLFLVLYYMTLDTMVNNPCFLATFTQ